MPRISEKQRLFEIVIEDAADRIMWIDDMQSSDDDDEVMEILEELNEDLLTILACTRGIVSSKVPKTIKSSENVLSNMNDETFQQMLHVDRKQFQYLISIIADDIEFTKKHSCRQFSVELQLAVVLYRLGLYGKDGVVRHIATIFGIGNGGTLSKITKRIFSAILKLMPKYLYWPSSEERAQIVADTYHELPHCIGYVDETKIKLAVSLPMKRKTSTDIQRNFAIKTQIVCDHKMRIRNVAVEKVNNQQDMKVFRNVAMHKRKEKFFEYDQWLAGDAAYQLSDIVITPYGKNCEQLTYAQRNAFNREHNKYRVRVEHCLCLLRKKFASLNELRVRIDNNECYTYCYEWIQVCCVLYNLLLKDEEINEIWDNALHENDLEYDNSMDDVLTNEQFESKRQNIFNLMFKK